MKTVLFTTSWLKGCDDTGDNRLSRTQRYLTYYRPLKDMLGFQNFYLADNASPMELLPPDTVEDIGLYRFPTELTRGYEKQNDYPYCWRGFYWIKVLMQIGLEKIIICDTDAFILSRRMADFIRETNSGYHTVWSPTCQQPISEISVLCQDAFPMMLGWFNAKTWQERSDEGKCFETELPYTHIHKEFKGDRYGQKAHFHEPPQQTAEMDFYAQSRLNVPLRFDMRES